MQWIENILDKIMFTVLADPEHEADEATRADIVQHFGHLANNSSIYLRERDDDCDSEGTSDVEQVETAKKRRMS